MKKILLATALLGITSALYADNFIMMEKKICPPCAKQKKAMKNKPFKAMKKQNFQDESYWVQVGAFKSKKRATSREEAVSASCKKNINIFQKEGLNRVVVGPFKSKRRAMKKLRKLKNIDNGAFLTTPANFK